MNKLKDFRRPAPVKARDCSILAMCDGRNESKHPTIIQDGRRLHYVGIGWIDEGLATTADYRKFPEVKN
jgi:hypothetical protein